ncbi:MAG TPA: hypothetical protein VH437_00955 [Terriglobales bacterium]|jgi:hypothetical protein
MGSKERGTDWRPDQDRVLAELFHQFSQPLTKLRCALELALLKPGSAEGYRETIRQAAIHVNEVAQAADFIRKTSCSQNRSLREKELRLEVLLGELIADLAPLAGEKDCWFEAHINEFVCMGEAQPLRSLLLFLLEFVIEESRGTIRVEMHKAPGGHTVLLVTSLLKDVSPPSSAPYDRITTQVQLLEIYRYFESRGGRVSIFSEDNRLQVRIELVAEHTANFSHSYSPF